ncbi:MAG: Carboxypeptidase regulatory-like domain [Chthonomonadaceae bacterium]|nr:Carboxypeptidase regulatory-like domain [Chthonomonadaceae bacterium]
MTPVTPGHPVSPDGSGIPCADGSASHGAVRAESRLFRRAFAGGKGMVALVALWLLCGCSGGLAFTGGSIPPGGTRLVGRVAAAENPLAPLAHVTVQVVTQPITGGTRTLTATTGVDGAFIFPSVPTGRTTTVMTVTATPDPTEGRQSQQVVFQAQNGVTDDLVVALPLKSFDVTLATSLTLHDITTVPPGYSTTIHTRLLDSGGKRLSVQPTLLFAGNFGSIAIDETFAATEPGFGTITAFWYNLPNVTTQILVDPKAPQPPPAPPDLPPAQNPGTITDTPGVH